MVYIVDSQTIRIEGAAVYLAVLGSTVSKVYLLWILSFKGFDGWESCINQMFCHIHPDAWYLFKFRVHHPSYLDKNSITESSASLLRTDTGVGGNRGLIKKTTILE
jgi:hypothetical protein